MAMAEAMAEKGYVATSVQDVLRRAAVSRQTFYQLFDSKIDCFMAAFDGAGRLLLDRVMQSLGAAAAGGGGTESGAGPMERFEQAVTSYLDALSTELPYARLFLVEVYAAGPEAVKRRSALQGSLAGTLAEVLGVTGEAGRYTCQIVVSAMSAMVTPLVAANDAEALRAAGPPLIAHVRRLWDAGVFDG